MEERRFWTFEAAVCFFGVVSAISVFVRQKQLDHKMYKRIQKQGRDSIEKISWLQFQLLKWLEIPF